MHLPFPTKPNSSGSKAHEALFIVFWFKEATSKRVLGVLGWGKEPTDYPYQKAPCYGASSALSEIPRVPEVLADLRFIVLDSPYIRTPYHAVHRAPKPLQEMVPNVGGCSWEFGLEVFACVIIIIHPSFQVPSLAAGLVRKSPNNGPPEVLPLPFSVV